MHASRNTFKTPNSQALKLARLVISRGHLIGTVPLVRGKLVLIDRMVKRDW